MSPVLRVERVSVRFRVARGGLTGPRWLQAVDDVNFQLERGEILGVVGESGCGKSTLGRALLGLVPLATGSVWLAGQRLDGGSGKALRRLRREAQMIFQDPQGSLDPRMTIGQSIAEPLEIFEPGRGGAEVKAMVAEALEQVGLGRDHADRFPHEISGGQCQRAGIARAVILRPLLVVCDEPVSALDVSIQGQVVNLLVGLRETLGLTYVFISHNLAVVRHVSTTVLVMYLGRVMEQGPRDLIYDRPLHPYTRALLDAIPPAEPGAVPAAPLGGELPSPLAPPPGCAFSTRCPRVTGRCRRESPRLEEAQPGHFVACLRWREWPEGLRAAIGQPTG